jgi:DNA-directed RNA polymerase subunit M/transcription elongation factor TFIIS
MTEYCENCGEELEPDEEEEGICKKCKNAEETEEEYQKDEDFIDPAVT